MPWFIKCPVCSQNDSVRIFDKGLKFLLRICIGDSRLVCDRCKITWRQRDPYYCQDLISGREQNDDKFHIKPLSEE